MALAHPFSPALGVSSVCVVCLKGPDDDLHKIQDWTGE